MRSKTTGPLKPDAELPYLFEAKVMVPMLGKRLVVTYNLESRDYLAMDEVPHEFDEALTKMLSMGKEDGVESFTDAIYGYYTSCVDVPVIDKSKIWNHLKFETVYLVEDPDEPLGRLTVVLHGKCKWEREHGIALVLRRGDQFERVGQNDGNFYEY